MDVRTAARSDDAAGVACSPSPLLLAVPAVARRPLVVFRCAVKVLRAVPDHVQRRVHCRPPLLFREVLPELLALRLDPLPHFGIDGH